MIVHPHPATLDPPVLMPPVSHTTHHFVTITNQMHLPASALKEGVDIGVKFRSVPS